MTNAERASLGCSRLLMVLLLCAAAAGAGWAQKLDVSELDTTAGRTFRFENFTGQEAVVQSVPQITGIGEVLSRTLRAGGTRGDYFGKYTVIRAWQPDQALLGADLIVLGDRAQIDDIRNIQRIVAGYLQAEFGYDTADAARLSMLVTTYNAAYRGDVAALSKKYTPLVMSYLSADNAGIALSYTQWPGKTRLIIPLGQAAGSQTAGGQTGGAPTGPGGPSATAPGSTTPGAVGSTTGGPGTTGAQAGGVSGGTSQGGTTTGGTTSGGTSGGAASAGGASQAGGAAGGAPSGGTTSGGTTGGATTGGAAATGGTSASGSGPGGTTAQAAAGTEGGASSSTATGATGTTGTGTTPGGTSAAAAGTGRGTPTLFAVAWWWWLLGLAALLVLALLVFAVVRIIRRLMTPSYERELARSVHEGHPLVEMVVIPQNRRIGHRNIHYLKPGGTASVGSGMATFLIYFVPVPRRMAQLKYDGRAYSLVPLKSELFPGTSGPVTDVLGKGIPARSPRGYKFTIVFRRFIPPLEEINRLMRSTRPGSQRRIPPA